MDLTALGPYALNVRTNISSYGPRARLIRAYYNLPSDRVNVLQSISSSYVQNMIENMVLTSYLDKSYFVAR